MTLKVTDIVSSLYEILSSLDFKVFIDFVVVTYSY